MNTTTQTRPGFAGRLGSRQWGLPTGLIGRFFGRAMEGATDIARVPRPGGALAIACRTSDTATAAWIDPSASRVLSAAQVVAMLHTAGFDQVDHQRGDASNRDIRCFPRRLLAGTT